jgi:hypothetical protein
MPPTLAQLVKIYIELFKAKCQNGFKKKKTWKLLMLLPFVYF